MSVSEDRLIKLRYEMRRKQLLEQATLVEVETGLDTNRDNNVNLLCNAMEGAAKTGPVKAEYEGRMFVVDKGAKREDILQAWKEQAWKPYLSKEFDEQTFAGVLKSSAKNTDFGDTVRSYMNAAMTEVLVTKYPEHTDDLSTLQLLNAFRKSSRRNVDTILKALTKSAKDYIDGKETFPPTLKNMAGLDENKGLLKFALGVGVNFGKLEERIQESELKMLKNLKPEDLEAASDLEISAGIRIAERHSDAGEYGKMFAQETMKRFLQSDQKQQG